MKSVFWEGKPFEMSVKRVPRAIIVNDDDAVVRVTTSAICGTDLHVYHGVFGSSQVPYAMGHEAIGIVVEVGNSVDTVKVGDRVIIPDLPDDGHLDIEPTLIENFTVFGLGKEFGNLGGCQAEFVRVPFADKSLFIIDDDKIPDNELLFLTDIFATAWGCLDFSGFQPGDDVTVFGAGPVGLLCAYSALLRGASRVFSVDHIPARLEKAKSIGAIPINLAKGKPADQILKIAANGTTRVCDCIGFECLNEKLKPDQGFVINQAVQVASAGGGIGVIGVYFAEPNSKGTPRGTTLSPNISFPITQWWEKNLSIKGGGVDPKPIIPILLELVKTGRAKPSFIISAEFQGLDEAPEGYRRFDKKLETKIVFKFPWSRRLSKRRRHHY
ncbi:putative alcohol dehydrogenase [Coniochaeta sp. PMI_546]|nr:putative alcohol dehydrogenase [Coniochaeta sp. PMI_546]